MKIGSRKFPEGEGNVGGGKLCLRMIAADLSADSQPKSVGLV